MKTNNLLYVISLIIIAASIILVVKYPDSGRANLIAGALTVVGFALNIAVFTMKKG